MSQSGNTLVGAVLVYIVVAILLGVGWLFNVVRFCQCDFKAPYKAEIIRGVGIVVAPVGGVAGWITIADGYGE